MALAEESRTTATAEPSNTILPFPVEKVTGSGAMALSREYGDLREEVEALGADVAQEHHKALARDWRDRTSKLAQRAAPALLALLADERGLSWTAISKLLGLTVQTLRNWRRGEAISGENRSKLAGLVAYLDVLWSRARIEDPSSWLEVPILAGVPLTPVDAYAHGILGELFEFACNRLSPDQVLDRIDPNWRKKYEQSGWEVFEAGDGQVSIRAKKQPG